MLLFSFALLALVSFAIRPDLVEQNRQLKKTNSALLKALKSLALETESQVGGSKKDCTNPPDSKCELCEGVKDYCSGKRFVRTTYPLEDVQYSWLFGCSYPETYTYVDSCDAVEKAVGDCLSEPPAPRCEGDTLVTFVEPGTADSRGCMVYGREENDCDMGHCNAAAGKCDEITASAPIPCSSMIGEDWMCMGCWQNKGNACTAKKWGSPTPIPGVCNDKFGCVKAVNEETAVAADNCEFNCRKAGHGDQCRGWCNIG